MLSSWSSGLRSQGAIPTGEQEQAVVLGAAEWRLARARLVRWGCCGPAGLREGK